MKKIMLVIAIVFSTIFTYSQTISDNEFVNPILCYKSYGLNNYSEKSTPYYLSGNLPFTSLQHDSMVTANNQYEKYKKQYNKSRKNASTGSVIMGIGAVTTMTGLILNGKANQQALSHILLTAGFVIFNIGAPVTVSNSVKASNNKKAMEKTKSNTNLSFGLTNNGVGLVMTFN